MLGLHADLALGVKPGTVILRRVRSLTLEIAAWQLAFNLAARDEFCELANGAFFTVVRKLALVRCRLRAQQVHVEH